MKNCRELSLQRVIRWSILITTSAAVVIATAIITIGEVHAYKRGLEVHVAELASSIRRNSTEALLTKDSDRAQSVLQAVKTVPNVTDAHLLDINFDTVATYRNVVRASEPILSNDVIRGKISESARWYRGWQSYGHAEAIIYDGKIIGHLVIRSSLDGMWSTLRRLIAYTLIAYAFAIALGFLVSKWLASRITQPITHLIEVIKKIHNDENLSIRATRFSDDYIGLLTDRFNNMLEHVDSQNRQLRERSSKLVREVNMRTASMELKTGDIELAIQNMRDAKEETDHASEAKSEFLAKMLHKSRGPTTGVLGPSEFLKGFEALSAKQNRYLNTILQSGERLLMILKDMLDFTKIESGCLEIKEHEFQLHTAVYDVMEMFAESAESKGLELLCDVASEVEDSVVGDELRFKQVLTNLLANAIKFTSSGEIVIRLTSTAKGDDTQKVRVAVLDTGIGTDSNIFGSIFDSVSQQDGSSTRQLSGTGIGLVICRQLVDLMGGSIGVRNRKSGGSEFWIELTLNRSDELSIHHDVSVLAQHRALVVDDNVTSLAILSHQLESVGIDVCTEVSGDSVVPILERAKYENRSFDFLILDMNMPGINGIETARMARNHGFDEDVFIILLSPSVANISHLEKAEGGVQCVLSKPVQMNELLIALAESVSAASKIENKKSEELRGPRNNANEDNIRVLLVEDNSVNQMVAVGMLTHLGCDVVVSEHGAEALKSINKDGIFDLILMDCQMPVLDGYDTSREIRKIENRGSKTRLPIVALTANALMGEKEKCLESGMDDYLSKPFSLDDLHKTLLKHIDKDKSGLLSNPDSCHTNEYGREAETEEESDTTSQTIIDGSVIENLRRMQGDDDGAFMREVVRSYIANSPKLVTELELAIEQSEYNAIAGAAHVLKSSSANVGAGTFSQLCRKIEARARNGQYEQILDVQDHVRPAFELVISELRQLTAEGQ